MKIFHSLSALRSPLSRDVCLRWLLATAKVAVLFGLLLFLLSFCSCSSARRAEQVSVSTSDTVSMVSAKVDSVASSSSVSSRFSQLVKVSGLEIIFPEPVRCSVPDTVDMVSPAPRASPSKIHIDELEINTSSGSDVSMAKDSVSSGSRAGKSVSGSKSSEVKIRSPATAKWQVAVVFVFVLLVIVYTGYMLYCSNRPRDQTAS